MCMVQPNFFLFPLKKISYSDKKNHTFFFSLRHFKFYSLASIVKLQPICVFFMEVNAVCVRQWIAQQKIESIAQASTLWNLLDVSFHSFSMISLIILTCLQLSVDFGSYKLEDKYSHSTTHSIHFLQLAFINFRRLQAISLSRFIVINFAPSFFCNSNFPFYYHSTYAGESLENGLLQLLLYYAFSFQDTSLVWYNCLQYKLVSPRAMCFYPLIKLENMQLFCCYPYWWSVSF